MKCTYKYRKKCDAGGDWGGQAGEGIGGGGWSFPSRLCPHGSSGEQVFI